MRCINAGPFCVPPLRQGLSRLSFQTLYKICETHKATRDFWWLSSLIMEMLHKHVSYGYLCYSKTLTNCYQKIKDTFPRLIHDLLTVCFYAFYKAEPDKELTLLVYEAQFSHILQLEATNPASAFPLNVLDALERQLHRIIGVIVTLHPQPQRFVFTGRHYAMISGHFIDSYLRSGCWR